MQRFWLAICMLLVLAMTAQGQSSTTVIRLSRIAGVPDQMVGGQILSAVYAKLGVKVEFVDVPAERALVLSNSGELDGEIQRIPGVEKVYTSLVPVPVSINYIEPSVFTTGMQFDVNGWESIRSYNIGIVRGVGSSERGTKGMPHVEAVGDLDNLMLMLDHGRIDVAVTDLLSGRIELKKLQLENRIHPLTPPLQRIYLYHYLNERHRDLAKRVEAELHRMEQSGELKQLHDMFVQQALELG